MATIRKHQLQEILWEWGYTRLEGDENWDELWTAYRYQRAFRIGRDLPVVLPPSVDYVATPGRAKRPVVGQSA